MADWIANGESGGSVREKLNSLIIPISSGTIAVPTLYFDVELPSGYSSFKFMFNDVEIDTAHISACFIFSIDDGMTWYNDATNFDTYVLGVLSLVTLLMNTAGAVSNGSGADSVAFYSFFFDGRTDFCLDINPGDSSNSFKAVSNVLLTNASPSVDGNYYQSEKTVGGLNPAATVTPTLGRINKMRVMPYGNGDNPPTSGQNIIAGNWRLFGVPSA